MKFLRCFLSLRLLVVYLAFAAHAAAGPGDSHWRAIDPAALLHQDTEHTITLKQSATN